MSPRSGGVECGMASQAQILSVLDALAEEFEFPGFNNINYETADSRMHLFRDDDRWALVIEELVDWPAANGLETLVFAMGDIQGDALSTLQPIETELSWDDDDELIVPDSMIVRGTSVDVDHAALERACSKHDIESSFGVLLQLIEARRDALFATKDELEAVVAPGLKEILTLDAWSHPDVYGGPKPSESEAFQQVADVLSSGDASHWAPTEEPNNRDWQHWLESR